MADGNLTLEDLGSTNGTKLNGQALSPGEKQPLKGGDIVSLGGYEVRISLPGDVGANATGVISSNKTAAISASVAPFMAK